MFLTYFLNRKERRELNLRVFITGDTHIPYDIHKLNTKNFPIGKELNKEDIVIICGDFGGVWEDNKEERFWISWLESKPWTTVFVDGNHECFPRLNELPETEWFGGKVGIVSKSIFHLKRGQYFHLPNHLTLFTLGGAHSHDKQYRTEGVNWWKEEVPSKQELSHARNVLDAHNWTVDLIVTHDASLPVIRYFDMMPNHDEFSDFLNEMYHRSNFSYWANGHLHKDALIEGRLLSTYNDIWEISKVEGAVHLTQCLPETSEKKKQ